MKKRLTFKCWNCQREYSLTLDLEGARQFVVACPYCEKEATADLRPYDSVAVDIFKSVDRPVELSTVTLSLPDVIPTTQPKE